MKINMKPISTDFVTVLECFEEDCPYIRYCANHVTAEDYRVEDGLVPNITGDGLDWHCDQDPICSLQGAVLSNLQHSNEHPRD